ELGVPGLAGRDPRGLSYRIGRAPHPLEHARDPQPGLYPHRPRQGPYRAERRAPPCPSQCGDPGTDGHRASDRLAPRRRRHHRIGVRVAGHGQAHRGCHLLSRFPGGPNGAHSLRHRLRRNQSPRGPALHGHRSPHPLFVMTSREEAGPLRRWGRRHPTIAIGGILLGVVVFASLLAPTLTSYDPVKPSFSQRLAPPWGLGGTRAHLLGTDNLGRDILARLLHGGRISLALAVSAVAIAGAVGVGVGLAASWDGGTTDAVIMRVADVQLAFPLIMLAIAIVAVVGTN